MLQHNDHTGNRMVDVFVHRTGLDTAAVEESRDLVQVVSDGGKLPCDGFDLVRVDMSITLSHPT